MSHGTLARNTSATSFVCDDIVTTHTSIPRLWHSGMMTLNSWRTLRSRVFVFPHHLPPVCMLTSVKSKSRQSSLISISLSIATHACALATSSSLRPTRTSHESASEPSSHDPVRRKTNPSLPRAHGDGGMGISRVRFGRIRFGFFAAKGLAKRRLLFVR